MTQTISVVLLPGLNGTSTLLQRFISLAPNCYKLIIMEYATQKKESYPELVANISEKTSKITGPYIVIGESFSGPIAVFLSSMNRKNHVATVLVASFVSAPGIALARFLPWTLGFDLAKPLYAIRESLAGPKQREIIQAAAAELNRVSSGVLSDRVKSALSVDAREALAQSNMPMAYFRANTDYVVPDKNLKTIKKIKPSVKVYTFDSSHFLLQYNPQEAWQALDDFVADCKLNVD